MTFSPIPILRSLYGFSSFGSLVEKDLRINPPKLGFFPAESGYYYVIPISGIRIFSRLAS